MKQLEYNKPILAVHILYTHECTVRKQNVSQLFLIFMFTISHTLSEDLNYYTCYLKYEYKMTFSDLS